MVKRAEGERSGCIRAEFWVLMAGSIVAVAASFMGWW